MRGLVLLAFFVAGCANDLGMREARDARADDAGSGIDAPSSEVDAPGLDAPLGTDAPAIDAPTTDAGPPCTPTRTACRGELECGPGPNGCPGGTLDCGECTGGELWCAVIEPMFLGAVMSCVGSVIAAHPEYFDPAMECSGSSPYVMDARAAEYVRDVAACVGAATGAVAIVDPNAPMNEIRVRAAGGDVADNYPVRVYSTGCTRRAYTSSCTPAGF